MGVVVNEALTSDRKAGERPIVLVVDDEPDLLELVSLTLSRMNLETRTAPDLGSARRLLKAERFDLCLTDMRLPDGDGIDLVAWIQQNRPAVPVAVITAHGNVESAVRALKLGAFDFVSKPLDLGVLRKLVGTAIRVGAAMDAATVATLRGPRLLGSSAVMEQLREMIANSGKTVNGLAVAIGMPQQVLQRFVSGARDDLHLSTADKLCSYFGVRLTSPKRRKQEAKGKP